MKISEFVKKVSAGEISVEEHTRQFLDEAKKINDRYSYFMIFCEDEAIARAKDLDKQIKAGTAKGKLLGVPVSVKDCICVKGVESRGGSAILNGYKPVFNATIIEKVLAEGAVIVGKTGQDEFGFGSFGVNVGVGFKPAKNPIDADRVCGGSSSGSGGITRKTTLTHVSIAESTGGSIVSPAAFCGVVGLCPTYGRVSRYGLIDYANSLDKIGSMGKCVEDAEILFDVIAGHDKRDATSVEAPVFEAPKKLRVGLIKEAFDCEAAKVVSQLVKKLEDAGVEVSEISLPLTAKYGISSYYVLATSETSTNLAKYCGMRYGASLPLEGQFNDYFSKVRSKFLGDEAKRRIILGTFARMAGYRDAFYVKAAKVRARIINEYKSAFKHVDVLVCPTMPIVAPRFDAVSKLSPLQNYMLDVLTVGPNLAGLPHLSIPCGEMDGLPVGMMFIGDHFKECNVIAAGKLSEGLR